MKFKINNRTWAIKETPQEEIRKEFEKHCDKVGEGNGRYFGVTWHDTQEIYLDKDLNEQRKRITLMHELSHCYVASFFTHQDKQYDEEMLCDIVANSHDIIHEIVTKYFNK
jgi:Zn-dependent peptidase ImmA (M78 family)